MVVLWTVCGVAREGWGDMKTRHVGFSAGRGRAVGNRVESERGGVGVLVVVRWPEGERRVRSLGVVVSDRSWMVIR